MGRVLGVDLSHHNGEVNFYALKGAGVQFVMLKLGGEESSRGSYKIDSKFFTNYHKAKAAGLDVGAYMFAGKTCWNWNPEENAEYFIRYMEKNGVVLDYPFVIDIETQGTAHKKEMTEYVYDWCSKVEELGYFTMIYGSDISTFDDILESERLERFAFWVARYGSESKIKHPWAMWQFTNNISGREEVGGMKFPTAIDGDIAAYDMAEVIKRKHLNKK